MTNVWERFENIVNKDEVAEAKAQFEPIDAGDYKVTLEAITPSESKAGLPMLKGKFKIVGTNRIIFYNQMLQNVNNPKMTAVNVNEAHKFVNSLTREELDFETLGELAKRVEDIVLGAEYTVTVSYSDKDEDRKFPKLKIVGKDAEDIANPFN